MKSYTDIEQSKILSKILTLESADMGWNVFVDDTTRILPINDWDLIKDGSGNVKFYYAWSLAALLNILHSKTKNIPSLSGGGYKDGKYISDWCLDYEFDDGDYQKTFADNPVDTCYNMIIKLSELGVL